MIVSLRDVEDADLPLFFAQQRQAEAVWMAAYTVEDPCDHAAFLSRWEWILGHPNIQKQTILWNGIVVGNVMSFLKDEQPEVTYWIGREYWGKGIATAALRIFLGNSAQTSVFARAAADNVGSIRVLQKCGFKICAHQRGFANARGCEIDEVVLRKSI